MRPVGELVLAQRPDRVHERRQRGPRHGRVLGQTVQAEPGVEHGGHDLADAPVPLVRDRVGDRRAVAFVALGLVEPRAAGTTERGIRAAHQVVGPFVVDAQQRRVTLTEEQPSARPQQIGDDPRPTLDVRQPDQRADPGEHEVEAVPAEHVRSVVELADDEGRTRAGGASSEVRGGGDRTRREVVSGDGGGAESVERHGVGADVALQVDDVESGQGTERGAVELHHPADVLRIGERVEVVAVRTGVDRHAILPVGEIGRPLLVHSRP